MLKVAVPKEIDPPTTIARQLEAEGSCTWSYNQLPKTSKLTLVIAGTDDVVIPQQQAYEIQ
ncbi:MAG: hypothetical protein WAM14_07255 [Candidatus Nitrosopolaris sp.]